MKQMIIEKITDLAESALNNPGKYNGFMGISTPHKFFSKNNMSYYFEWCSRQFKEFVMVLMDDPEHYNFMVFKFMKKKQALQHARKISDELKTAYEKSLRGLGIQNIKILQFKDFVNNDKYKNILLEVRKNAETNPGLKKDLEEMMNYGIGGKIEEFSKKISEKELEKIKSILFQYIIEETAAIIYLTENGYPVELDPTIEFITKKRIYEGDFPEIYFKLNLTRRGHLFIHPEGITKNVYV